VRTLGLLVVFSFAGLVSSARADAVFSGSVSVTGATSCSDSGTVPSSLNLSCSSGPSLIATASGTVESSGGQLKVEDDVNPTGPYELLMSTVSAQTYQTYVLSGGTGTGTVDIFFDTGSGAFSTNWSCAFTLDGAAAQACGGTWDVEYGVPFTVGFDASLTAFANNPNPTNGDTIDFGVYTPGSGALTATPEPSSILLLLPGLGGVVFAARSRVRRHI
jgi:hypothetical protein